MRDGANTPLWVSGACVGINSPFQPLHSFMVYNSLGHQGVDVGADNVTIGDVNSSTAGNYLYIDHTAATPKFMFYGARTAFGTTSYPTSTVEVAGTFGLSGQVTVGATSATALTDQQSVVFATGNNATVTLPAASTCKGRVIVIKQTILNISTVVNSAGGLIEGGASYTMCASSTAR